MGVSPVQTLISSSKGPSTFFSPPYFINLQPIKSLLAPRQISKKPEIHPQRKKMPTLKAIELLASGTFFHFSRFFRDLKTWHGVCSDSMRSETTHGLGHNK